jgi:hypothetical protein
MSFKEYLEESKSVYADAITKNNAGKLVMELMDMGFVAKINKRFLNNIDVDISGNKDKQKLLKWMISNDLYGGLRKSSSDQAWDKRLPKSS